MQVHEFRRELQDAILRLQRIAQKIDDDHLREVEQNEVDAARNEAVAQARREIAAGVTHPDVLPISKNLNVSRELLDAENPITTTAKENQRKALEAHQAAAKAKEK